MKISFDLSVHIDVPDAVIVPDKEQLEEQIAIVLEGEGVIVSDLCISSYTHEGETE